AEAADGPVPDDVLKAVVTVLADWARSPGGWGSGSPDAPARPVGIVTMPSRTRPRLIASLAEGLARVGRLPLLGGLAYSPHAGE
ncbi:recombinase RecQ, partial [Streptomyces sp. TRM76130]|nr:recombinase RecQ [Streptomyces sp. TRM76130]